MGEISSIIWLVFIIVWLCIIRESCILLRKFILVKQPNIKLNAKVSNDGLGGYNAYTEDNNIIIQAKTKEAAVEELVSIAKRKGLTVTVEDLT